MKRKEARMVQIQPKGASNSSSKIKPTCVFEFNDEGSCPWGIDCKFNHNISETQKNDTDLKEVMKNKMNRVRRLNDQRRGDRQNVDEDNIRIPKEVLQKMHEILISMPGVNQETLLNREVAQEINVPKQSLQKMYTMLQEYPQSLNHF